MEDIPFLKRKIEEILNEIIKKRNLKHNSHFMRCASKMQKYLGNRIKEVWMSKKDIKS